MSRLNTYEQLQKWLKVTKTSTTPAELHGFLCGLIVGSCIQSDLPILQIMLDRLQNIRATKTNDQGLAAQWSIDTFRELQSEDCSFYLRLPSDGSLHERLEAIVAWSQAFIDILADCSIWSIPLEDEAKQALDELVAVSQVDTEMTPSTEEDEISYEDLVEHIKICVLTIFTSLTFTQQADSHDCDCCQHIH